MDHNYLLLAVPPLLFALAAHKFKDVDLDNIIKNYFSRVCPMCIEKEKENVEMDDLKLQIVELSESIHDYVIRNRKLFSVEEIKHE
tara:strand:+ start:111 stop:368 length:258 start_codon:yes stop_codon:yes gene_type:complete